MIFKDGANGETTTNLDPTPFDQTSFQASAHREALSSAETVRKVISRGDFGNS